MKFYFIWEDLVHFKLTPASGGRLVVLPTNNEGDRHSHEDSPMRFSQTI